MIDEKKELLKLKLKELERPQDFRVLRKRKGYVEALGNDIYLKFDYDKDLVNKIKILKCFAFDKAFDNRWRLKEFDYHKAKIILNLNKEFPKYYWIIDPKALLIFNDKIKEFEEKAKLYKRNLLIKKKRESDLEIKDLHLTLREFQKIGVEFIDANDGIAFIADEMGLGKSIQSIAYTVMKNVKTFIVCPKYLKYNWKDKIEKFTNKKALIYSKKKKSENIEDFDYIIVSYGEVATRKDALKKIKLECVILDESHFIKTTSSARTKAVKSVFSKYKKRILLSGTPIINQPIEFYEQFRFLRPDLISKKDSFGLRFANAKENQYGNKKGYTYEGASNVKELYSLMQFFYIKRLKSEVLDELPEKERNYLPYEYSLTEYNKYKKSILANNKDKTQDSLVIANKLLSYLSLEKMNLFDTFFRNLIEENPDKKIIVFSRFKPTQKKLWETYQDIGCRIVPEDSEEENERQRIEFETNPDKKICIASTGAAKGYDLVSSDTVFFMDMPFSPKTMDQAEDRSHRINQKNQVNIYIPILQGTIEEKFREVLEKKRETINSITDGNNDFLEIQKSIQSEIIASIF